MIKTRQSLSSRVGNQRRRPANLLQRADRGFTPLDEKDLWVLLRRRISQLPLKHFVRAANLGEFLRDLLEFFSRCHDEVSSPDDYDRYLAQVEAGSMPKGADSRSYQRSRAVDLIVEDAALVEDTFRRESVARF